MRYNLALLILSMIFMESDLQAQGGFEQYCYVKGEKMSAFVPMLTYTSQKNWYVEARYNYEEMNTFSFYFGRSFSNDAKLKYSVIPIIGAVMGQFNGGSAGVNGSVEYQKIFFSTQSQYTFSFPDDGSDFLFTWSELGYHPWKWFHFGLSTQITYLLPIQSLLSESGFVIGFTLARWTFPVYCFNPLDNAGRYLVLGINFSADAFRRNR